MGCKCTKNDNTKPSHPADYVTPLPRDGNVNDLYDRQLDISTSQQSENQSKFIIKSRSGGDKYGGKGVAGDDDGPFNSSNTPTTNNYYQNSNNAYNSWDDGIGSDQGASSVDSMNSDTEAIVTKWIRLAKEQYSVRRDIRDVVVAGIPMVEIDHKSHTQMKSAHRIWAWMKGEEGVDGKKDID
eukprot:PhF_6_TR5185/c2_g1_i1/m.7455